MKTVSKLFATGLLLLTAGCSAIAQNESQDATASKERVTPGFTKGGIDKLDKFLGSNEFERLTSVVISKDDQVVYERYLNGFDKNSLHDTRSVTKTITAILIGIAIDKGFIPSVNEKAFKYFPEKFPYQNQDPRKEALTIRDLLAMSTVLECNDSNPASRGNEERMYIVEDYFKFLMDLPIAGTPPWETPVEELPYKRRFSYCTANSVFLGGILEKATKMKVDQFAEKYLFDPLEIKKVKWQRTPMGMVMTGGGLKLSARAYINIGRMYLNDGMFNGKRVLSKQYVRESTTPVVHTGQKDVDYAYQWWLPKYGPKERRLSAFAMFGNGGNKIAVFPKEKMVIVLTNRLYGRRQGHDQTARLLNEFIIPALD